MSCTHSLQWQKLGPRNLQQVLNNNLGSDSLRLARHNILAASVQAVPLLPVRRGPGRLLLVRCEPARAAAGWLRADQARLLIGLLGRHLCRARSRSLGWAAYLLFM